MIVSASRRTDIPAFHADWFFDRLAAGGVQVTNPYNAAQTRWVDLAREAVDGIVFWTKNPAPMLARLGRLEGYAYYFNVTLTGYGASLEPAFGGDIAAGVRALSRHIGPKRVVWRYDPMVFGGSFTPRWHAENFARLAESLDGAAAKCVVSFYDEYRHTAKRMAALGLRGPDGAERAKAAELLAEAAKRAGVRLQSCCEDMAALGIPAGACIDAALLSAVAGRVLPVKRDPHQRPGCGCAQSVDIGSYNTCPGGCVYCYATRRK